MSNVNLFLGIGGTGSKAVENFIHVCFSGLGPSNVWLGMVDQDSANGNVAKTKATLDHYIELRNELKTKGKNFFSDEVGLLKTKITYTQNNYCWCPLEGTNPSLHELFSYDLMNEKLQDIADVLYDPNEEFQLPLDEGFRARPSIGAAAMLSRIQQNNPFWKDVFEAIESAKSGNSVKIFLSSSIFGGTGAAGFPSIARVIRRMAEQEGLSQNIQIGGCLMLPYFSFPKPPEEEEGLVGYSDSFIEQSKGALDYYHRIFGVEEKHIFNQLYVMGWDPLIPLDQFEKGGNKQINPPLLPELYSALAAAKFFNEDKTGSGIYHIASDQSGTINWSDIPEINDDENFVRKQFAQTIRFSLASKEIYMPALLDNWSNIKSEAWFKKLFNKAGLQIKDQDDNKESIALINGYCETYLKWIADMILFSEFEGLNQNLIQAELFANKNNETGNTSVFLDETLPDHKLKLFSKIIHGVKATDLSNIFYDLNDTKGNSNATGLGLFIEELYKSSDVKGVVQ